MKKQHGISWRNDGKRHADALAMQQGALNPSGIAHAIIDACQEARDEGKDATKDSAVRFMAHQLAFICGVGEIEESFAIYNQLMDECAAAYQFTLGKFPLRP